MDSKIQIIEKLVEVGKTFTSRNFCFPNSSYPGEFGGEDTSEWFEWKTRVKNIIDNSMADNSPAVKLTSKAINIKTSGNYFSKFEEVNLPY